MKDIGDRMKDNYENRAQFYLTRRTPVIIRLDGRAFHTYTQGFNRPFDDRIAWSMHAVAAALAKDIQGAKILYVQSDEISILLTDWDTLQTQAWLDYNISKMVSLTASTATVAFNQCMQEYIDIPLGRWAQFDSRAFNIPLEEVSNYFVWRAKDWHRNSIMMQAQSVFSHRQLHGKSCSDVLAMLDGTEDDWTNLAPREKNGTFWYRCEGEWGCRFTTLPNFNSIDSLIQLALPKEEQCV